MTALLEVRNLSKAFVSGGGLFKKARSMHAVNDVSFDVGMGRVVGVVGESGCGKSTLARLILRLIEPTQGTVTFDGLDVLAQPAAAMRKLRARMQMVFQDPYSAIDPRYTIEQAVMESYTIQGKGLSAAETTDDRRRIAGNRRSQCADGIELSAPAFGRAEAARRHRAGTGLAACTGGTGRAYRIARCVGAGADHRTAGRIAGHPQPDLRFHQPRPVAGEIFLRRDPRHVSWACRGTSAIDGRCAAPSLHPHPDGQHVFARPCQTAGNRAVGGRNSQPLRPAPRLRLCRPLPEGDRYLSCGTAATCRIGGGHPVACHHPLHG